MTTEVTTSREVDTLLDILRESQGRLASTLATLDEQGIRADSYDDDWSIAQVASHLGSQNEIYQLTLVAAISGSEAPGPEQLQPIWDRWNSKAPAEQVRDAVTTGVALIERLEALPADVRDAARLDIFGRERNLAEIIRMRLAEHAMHTWDIVVALDPEATVQESALEQMVSQLEEFLGYTGRSERPLSVVIRTPARDLVLTIGPDGSQISQPGTTATDGELAMPLEALVRLLYGRLDEAHRSARVATGVAVDDVTAAFPGF